jgi:glutamate-1-semialdehyde 2,1-aminomutase
VVLADPNDVDGLRRILASDPEIAAAIVEPTGGSFGMVPLAPSFLVALRELTAAHGALLIFDEVVTGFRVAPGGAQGHFGIRPDLSTLAKIVAGGMPGGAVAGRADVLAALDFAASAAAGAEKIQHPGTFNANPVSAAAGIAALDVIASTDACDRANASAAALRQGMNEVLEELDVPWAAYGTFSAIHLFTNPKGRALRPADFDPFSVPYAELKSKQSGITHRVRIAMLLHGVDLNNWPGGITSAALRPQDVADTVDAFRDALRLLRREGDLG